MSNPSIWMAVAAGGALGAVARYGVSRAAMHWLGPAFPWGTLAANVFGSFLMGVLIAWLASREPQTTVLRAFLAVGLLGAFTTFSTFSFDVVALYRDRTIFVAAVYLFGSIVFAIGGLVVGLLAGRAWL
ncbi:MAG: fluoride efflux transporter CrcB [Pseudomonadota bacterium]